MYITQHERRGMERQLALLELFITKKGLLTEFIKFGKQYTNKDITAIDKELKKAIEDSCTNNNTVI